MNNLEELILVKDETERNLGPKKHTCRICGASGDFISYLAREMMQDKRDEFEYFECPECGCLQIAEIPANLGEYYGEGYYSFSLPENPDREYKTPATNHSKVLDVGCGSGAWLVILAESGYDNLFGCDPFLEKDIHHGDRVHIRNCSIHEVEGDNSFKIIHMGDSFEHVSDPLEVLKSARRLLSDDGVISMSIPTYPNIAFDMFGPHWYQLDPPRHLFLHSRKSLEYLAEKTGLKILEYKYDSNVSQIIRSYFYENGIPYNKIDAELAAKYFSPEQMQSLVQDVETCNENQYGDHMTVTFAKAVSE